jgi:hypothetical protein
VDADYRDDRDWRERVVERIARLEAQQTIILAIATPSLVGIVIEVILTLSKR